MISVEIEGDQMSVHFNEWGPDAYQMFLKVKRLPEYQIDFKPETETYRVTAPSRFAPMLGAKLPRRKGDELPYNPRLFDDQVFVVRQALAAKRFAIWKDCGGGKTFDQLEWARQVAHRTGGRVLIITVNEVVQQTIEEAAKFYGDTLPIVRINSKAGLRLWCREGPGQIAITNYEKMNPDDSGQEVHELRHLAGIVLDESSRLKTGGGKQKWAIIKSSRGIEYKLSCTATPAPNDTMEFASQASFLEKMRSEGEIIWTYFTRHPKTHRWTVKKHARKAFFEFMSGWSIYVRDPRRYGWRADLPDVPKPEILTYAIEPTPEQRELIYASSEDESGQAEMFAHRDTNTIQRGRLSQIAKGFRYVRNAEGKKERTDLIPSLKPAKVAEIVAAEVAAGHQVLVWTVFDAETRILSDLLRGAGVAADLITGGVPKKKRLPVLERFRRGESRVLISRASMLGYGMNFQCCSSMVFSGWNDSYEQWYQAIRRAYRFGQTRALRVHVPVVPELEGAMLENITKKECEFEASIAEMERNYIQAMRAMGVLKGGKKGVAA